MPLVRLACAAALLLLLLVDPVDPQWRALRAASSVLAAPPSWDISVPVNQLRYPGQGQGKPSRSAGSREQPQRSRRQHASNTYSKQGTFALLRQLIAETSSETRTAFNQIADILGSQFADSAPRPGGPTTTTTTTTPASSDGQPSSDSASDSASSTTTTTPAPYRISRQELFGILQRNSIGLGRLFRREYNSAMEDSKVNLNRFKQEFRQAVAPFLQPATTAAPSSTTSSR